jgi:YVTN family beta-propeller protein
MNFSMTPARTPASTGRFAENGSFRPRRLATWMALGVFLILLVAASTPADRVAAEDAANTAPATAENAVDRSPIDLDLSPDGRWLVTANETSNTVSLIDVRNGKVIDEAPVGEHPVDVEFLPDGATLLVTAAWSGELRILEIADERLQPVAAIPLGFEPTGLTVTADGSRAYVGLAASGQVAEVDLSAHRLVRRIDVGHWPRSLTLSADDSRLAVGCSGESKVAVIDTETAQVLYEEPLANGINIGHMIPSADGLYAYFTWMVYRTNPITEDNIRRGWVLASRIGRVKLDGPSYREAISLDVPRKAVADPYGIVISSDQQRMVASSSGTHELLVYQLPDLPFQAVGGPGDLIDRALERDRERFFRIDVGGRPMGLQMADDSRTVYVANYLTNAVQVVDLDAGELVGEIPLGSGPPTLARRGMEIFYDGQRSLDQWYSCHSCHQDGGINSRPMDTFNDGTPMTLKTVLPLQNVAETGPWTWHGWQQDLGESIHNSLTTTMLGPEPSEDDVRAVHAYLETLQMPPNPYREADGSLSEAAERGRKIFESDTSGWVQCHNGPHFTDGKIHDVGLGSPEDHYEGYNTPSLIGVYRRVRLLHNGRARSLEDVLTRYHRPEDVAGTGSLTDDQLADLIAYLRSL